MYVWKEAPPALYTILAAAVTVEPFNPNETLLESEYTQLDRLAEAAPAETLIWADAVTTEEFDIPNVTLFELLKTIVPLV